jgi:hypothetical protein
VDRGKGSDGFARKRLPGALNDFRADAQDMPMRGRGCQVRPSIGGVGLRQLAQSGRTEQYSVTLDDREI